MALFQEAQQRGPPTRYGRRILTDASGPFSPIVTETEVESLAEWEWVSGEIFGLPEFGDWFARMLPLIVTGRREFYHIVT